MSGRWSTALECGVCGQAALVPIEDLPEAGWRRSRGGWDCPDCTEVEDVDPSGLVPWWADR